MSGGLFYPHCRAVIFSVFDGFGGDDTDPFVVGSKLGEPLIPTTASVHWNGYKDAGWSMDFDERRFPFTPEILRNAAVAIYMFETAGGDDDPDNYTRDDAWLVMAGLVDDADVTYDASGRVFHLEGRDYTGFLVDKTWNPGKSGKGGRIPLGRPLDETVQGLVDEAVVRTVDGHRTRTLTVRYVGAGAVPIVGGSLYKTKKRGVSVQSGRNYWDAIYGLCLKHGKICFVRGTELIISDPKTLTSDQAAIARAAIGGAFGSASSPAQLANARYLMYGRNLSSLKISRHMGHEQVAQIVASSYDPKTRRQLQAKYPDGTKVDISKTTGLGTKKDTIEYVTAPAGITDLATLKLFAQSYYHHVAKGEAKFKFETRDLRDLRDNTFLTTRPGDPLYVTIDSYNLDQLVEMTPEERFDRLMNEGFEEDVAEMVSGQYELIALYRNRPLYAKSVTLDWDVNQGITPHLEAINFVSTARDDR